MRDTNYVIAEVVRRTGYPEIWVEKVLRQFNEDLSEFINKKKGYNIVVPKVGRFSFRIMATDNYIQSQRKYKKHWENRLESGIKTNTTRTIVASKTNIEMIDINIMQCLLIKEEYLKIHAAYDRKSDYFIKTSISNMSRLLEYLDVSDVVLGQKKYNNFPKIRVQPVSTEQEDHLVSSQKAADLLSYLQSMQVRPESKDGIDEQPVSD